MEDEKVISEEEINKEPVAPEELPEDAGDDNLSTEGIEEKDSKEATGEKDSKVLEADLDIKDVEKPKPKPLKDDDTLDVEALRKRGLAY